MLDAGLPLGLQRYTRYLSTGSLQGPNGTCPDRGSERIAHKPDAQILIPLNRSNDREPWCDNASPTPTPHPLQMLRIQAAPPPPRFFPADIEIAAASGTWQLSSERQRPLAKPSGISHKTFCMVVAIHPILRAEQVHALSLFTTFCSPNAPNAPKWPKAILVIQQLIGPQNHLQSLAHANPKIIWTRSW